MNSWIPMLQDAAEMFVFLAVELSLLFIVISAGVSLIRQKVPDHKIQQMMGARKGKGYLLASLLGAVTPFCSCSTIPMLRGLLSAKAGFGPTLTFLFVSPLLNPIIVGLMWVTFGWKVTLLYAIIAAGVSVLSSIILDYLGFERHIVEYKNSVSGSCATKCGDSEASVKTNCCTSSAKTIINLKTVKKEQNISACCPSILSEKSSESCCSSESQGNRNLTMNATSGLIKLAMKDALQQFKDVLPYLLLSVLIGSFIYGFIPSEWIAAHAGADNPLAIPLSAVVGIPLYIRAEAVIPLASVLMTKGMGLGALMALIIGSAGASLTEVILLKSMFRMPMIIAFLTVILGMAILMGYLTQFLF
ncbi:permease [Salmonella enterica subsp. enterica serovar Kentucky]|uniref:Permease n=5 Tax=Enterobacteriaceae TaxID=543 RepID=A0A622BZK4_SALER|nr:permease [Salmonella enterica]EGO4318237.1 permease [Escherichia coli]EBL3839951.1 permease [Salmonella enterica subsp. enterica serovar Kentucky]ECA3145890.1 permease [Salmonella enterica subsp. enterica serovar Kentucky]ECV3284579.1 permease [Salmonella enterica subsp. enterica serovar Kentucky]ECY8930762.1 permease [Salmonella enterica subsp. enterica serovar Kentucky]